MDAGYRLSLASLAARHVRLPREGRDPARCDLDGQKWPCDAVALLSEVERLRNLVRELAETVHQTGSLRDHADPNDLTGWNVHGIETCEDSLCVDARAALVSEEGSR